VLIGGDDGGGDDGGGGGGDGGKPSLEGMGRTTTTGDVFTLLLAV